MLESTVRSGDTQEVNSRTCSVFIVFDDLFDLKIGITKKARCKEIKYFT